MSDRWDCEDGVDSSSLLSVSVSMVITVSSGVVSEVGSGASLHSRGVELLSLLNIHKHTHMHKS